MTKKKTKLSDGEISVQCLKCKEMETMPTYKGAPQDTGRFFVKDGNVFHLCGECVLIGRETKIVISNTY